MHSLKFLLDADMPKSSAQVIRNLGFEIEDVRDIGMRAAKDREIMDYAFKNNLSIHSSLVSCMISSFHVSSTAGSVNASM
jgi:predicted nuclease of predicted toxin-antitoxin system